MTENCTMSYTDLRKWAKEEFAEAIRQRRDSLITNDPEMTYDERTALVIQSDRLLKFMGWPGFK